MEIAIIWHHLTIIHWQLDHPPFTNIIFCTWPYHWTIIRWDRSLRACYLVHGTNFVVSKRPAACGRLEVIFCDSGDSGDMLKNWEFWKFLESFWIPMFRGIFSIFFLDISMTQWQVLSARASGSRGLWHRLCSSGGLWFEAKIDDFEKTWAGILLRLSVQTIILYGFVWK